MFWLGSGFALLGLLLSPDRLYQFDRYALPKEAIVHALAIAWTLALSKRAARLDALDHLALSFCALSALSGAFAQNHWLALRSVGLSVSSYALFRAARIASAHGQSVALLGCVAVGGAASAMPALLEAFGLIASWSTPGRVPGGTFGNRNAMAHAVAISLPAAVWLALRARSAATRLTCGVALALGTSVIVLSRSRAAWLGVACALLAALAYGFAQRREGTFARSRDLLGVGLAVALGLAIALLPNQLRWSSPEPYAESLRSLVGFSPHRADGRLAQARFTLAMVADAPLLGVGPGNWRVHAPRYIALDRARHAGPEHTPGRLPNHDGLGVWAERGSLALGCLLGLGFVLLRALWRAQGGLGRSASALGLAVSVLLLVMGNFDAVISQPVPAAFSALALGAVLPVGAQEPAAKSSAELALAWLMIAVAAVALARTGLQLAAGHVYAAQPPSIERLERAAKLDPAQFELARELSEYWISRQDCARAEPHLEHLERFHPFDRATSALRARCAR